MNLSPKEIFTKEVDDGYGGKTRGLRWSSVAGVGLAGMFGLFASTGIYRVQMGTAAVETTGGKVSDVALPGWNYAIPIVQNKHIYNTTKVQEIPLENLNIYYSPDDEVVSETEAAEAVADSPGSAAAETDSIAKQNAQQYTTHQAVIRASFDPAAIQTLHEKYQSMEAITRLIEQKGTEAYKAVVRKIDPLKINASREDIGPDARDLLQRRLNDELGAEGTINVESVVFVDFNFERGVEAAYETANQERASVQAEQFKLEKESIKVKTAEKAGEARGAEELAYSEQRAKAINTLGEALKNNPMVLVQEGIKAWSEGGAQVPQTLLMPAGQGPDISKFLQAAPIQIHPVQVGATTNAPVAAP